MEKNLVSLLKGLNKKLENVSNKSGKKLRYVKELNELIDIYSSLKIPTEYANEYEELIKKGTELNEGENYRNIKKIEKFLPMCFYLYYEIRGEAKQITRQMGYLFFIVTILFLIVSFPLYPFYMTILFVIPIFIGLRGLSKGQGRGLIIGITTIEFFTLTGMLALYVIVSAIPHFTKFLDALAKQYSRNGMLITTASMNIFVIIYTLLVIALIIVSIFTVRYSSKYKKMFF